jgi:hypothetical protein
MEIWSPGSYGALDVRSRADLFLTAGNYFFNSFNVEPQGRIHVDKAAGPIQLYVTGSSFQFKGSWVNTAGAPGTCWWSTSGPAMRTCKARSSARWSRRPRRPR